MLSRSCNYFVLGGLVVILAAFASPPSAAAPAARVQFSIGDVQAVSDNGRARALRKGAPLEQGETINTNNGRAQLVFTDGAFVSLQPGSEFRIDEYRFNGKADGEERGFFSLLKGGLRTITGLIGRSDKRKYQVTTTVATIGIRGTEYTIQYGNSVTGTVGDGEIEVCNGAGCLNVTNGESYYVQNQDVKPQISAKGTDLPPAPPENPPSNFAKGEEVDETGLPSSFVLAGEYVLDWAKIYYCDGACPASGQGKFTFDADGKLTDFLSAPVDKVSMSGNDGIIAWGTFVDAGTTGPLVHFVAGLPTPTSDLAALGGATGYYTLLGATPVTDDMDTVIGSLDSGSMKVSFGNNDVAANMNWTIAGTSVSADLAGVLGSNIAGNCGATCRVAAAVGVLGPSALRAGMIYELTGLSTPTGDAIGAAAFGQTEVR